MGLSDGHRGSKSQVDRLQGSTHDRVHPGLLWSKKIGAELKT